MTGEHEPPDSALAARSCCYHNESVPNVLIRDLPPEVHAILVRRAEAAGQSLQQYLVAELTRMANTPTMGEFMARVEQTLDRRTRSRSARGPRHELLSLDEVVHDIRRGRGE